MRIRRSTTLLAAVVAAAVLTTGCGGSGAGAGSAPTTGSSGGSTAATAGGTDMGPEAAFAPAGSLLYIRTPPDGPAWDALSRVRARIAGLENVEATNSIGNFLRLLTAQDFAAGPSVMLHSLTGEAAEVLMSNRAVKSKNAFGRADSIFYSAVSDHATPREVDRVVQPPGRHRRRLHPVLGRREASRRFGALANGVALWRRV